MVGKSSFAPRAYRATLFSAAAVVLLPAAMMLACTSAKSAVEETEAPRPAKLFEVRSTSRAASQSFPGEIRAADQVELSFRVSGPLSTLAVEEGDAVNEGDVVARIDPRDFRVQVNMASARLAAARARFDSTESEQRRARELVASRAMPTAQLDGIEGSHQVAAADVQGAQQALRAARLALGDTRLRAPFSGRVAAVRVERHQWISATRPVLLLRSQGRLEVGIDVPESKLRSVLDAPPGSVQVRFPSLGPELRPARVVSHQTEVDPLTKTYEVTLSLEDEVAEASPGMTAEAVWTRSGGDGSFVVPLAAVGTSPDGEPFVFRFEAGRLHATPVELGPPSDVGVRVLAGLAEGDVVLQAGVRAATDGQQVRPISQEDLGG